MLKKSIKKNYIAFCANGNLDKLKKIISSNPQILKFTNNYNMSGLYYSIKNLKKETTLYLIDSGLTIDLSIINQLISSKWRGSIESYIFLKDIGYKIYDSNAAYSVEKEYDQWLYSKYENFYYNHQEIDKLYKLMKYENLYNKEGLEKILHSYKNNKTINTSKKYLSNLRDIEINIILLQ